LTELDAEWVRSLLTGKKPEEKKVEEKSAEKPEETPQPQVTQEQKPLIQTQIQTEQKQETPVPPQPEPKQDVETKQEEQKSLVKLPIVASQPTKTKEKPTVTAQEQPQKPVTGHVVIEKTPEEYDLMPEPGLGKIVITIYSHKGHGKTDGALSFPGSICVISFDHKTVPVAQKRYRNRYVDPASFKSLDELIQYVSQKNDYILVWNGKRYWDESSPDAKLKSAEVSFNYLLKVLAVVEKLKPDWVVIDGTEIFHEIAEMLMRYRNGLAPFQGISNRNLWKERKMYMRQIHNTALNAAKRGVIYTLYPQNHNIKVVDGEVVESDEIPKWIDIVLYETDTVIKIFQKWSEGARRFYARVESNKSPVLDLIEGMDIDITDKKLYDEIVEKESS